MPSKFPNSKLEFALNLIEYLSRYANATAISDTFKPSRNVDAIAKNISAIFDDIPDIDADAKLNLLIRVDITIVLTHVPLKFYRAAYRFNDTRKFRQKPISGCFNNAAAMLGNFGVNEFGLMRLQRCMSAMFVNTHKPAIAGDISSKDSG